MNLLQSEMWWHAETLVTCAVSMIALCAIIVPFQRGLALWLRARRVTRQVSGDLLRERLASAPEAEEPFTLATLRVLEESLAENENDRQPRSFLRDATKQYMLNEYDAAYAQPISMYANILPPLGFIGTTVGLAVLFVSMHLGNDSLQLGALAIALSSTIFALFCFATLEGLRIALYGRMMRCLADALGTPRSEGAGQEILESS